DSLDRATVTHNVRVAMGDHHQVSGIHGHAIAILEFHESATFRKQVEDDYVFCLGSEMAGQGACRGRIDAPRRREFAVVEQSPPQPHHLQHFRENVHIRPPAVLCANITGLLNNLSVQSLYSGKKAGRVDKGPRGTLLHSGCSTYGQRRSDEKYYQEFGNSGTGAGGHYSLC